jgi:hypothetical protein
MKKWTVFDFEFNQLLPEIGQEWPLDLHIICGSIFSSGDPFPSVWHEKNSDYMSSDTLQDFLDFLEVKRREGHTIGTWGGSASDWRMFAKECPERHKDIVYMALNSVDVPLCSCICIGTMMGLNSACKALGFSLKDDDSSENIPELWKKSDERFKVLQHVSNDSYATLKVIEESEKHKNLAWITQKGFLKYWNPVVFYTVKECLQKELPKVAWTIMPNQNGKLMARWLYS